MGLHVVGRLRVREGLRLTGELVVEGDLDLRAAEVKEVPEGARVTGKTMTEGEPFSIWADFMHVSVGEIVDRMGMTWRDLAADFSERVRERVRAGVTYEQVEFRRARESAVPRHLQGAPHYRQIERRGGRRPLR